MAQKKQGGSHAEAYAEAATKFGEQIEEKAEALYAELSDDLLKECEVAYHTVITEADLDAAEQDLVDAMDLSDVFLAQAAQITMLNKVKRTVSIWLAEQNPEHAARLKRLDANRERLRNPHSWEGFKICAVAKNHPLVDEIKRQEGVIFGAESAAEAVIQAKIDTAVDAGGEALEYARLVQDGYDITRGKSVKDIPARTDSLSGLLGLIEHKE